MELNQYLNVVPIVTGIQRRAGRPRKINRIKKPLFEKYINYDTSKLTSLEIEFDKSTKSSLNNHQNSLSDIINKYLTFDNNTASTSTVMLSRILYVLSLRYDSFQRKLKKIGFIIIKNNKDSFGENIKFIIFKLI